LPGARGTGGGLFPEKKGKKGNWSGGQFSLKIRPKRKKDGRKKRWRLKGLKEEIWGLVKFSGAEKKKHRILSNTPH